MVEKKEPKSKIKELGKRLTNEIEKGENPTLDVPIRALSNVVFDTKTRLITMGTKSSKRFFFNVAHARKFVQTVDAAAIAKSLLEEGKHISLRQAYYMMKGTLSGANVEVVGDDQSESNKALEDLELITGLSREQLHVNASYLF